MFICFGQKSSDFSFSQYNFIHYTKNSMDYIFNFNFFVLLFIFNNPKSINWSLLNFEKQKNKRQMSNTEFRSFSEIFSEITKYLYIVCVCVCVMCFQFHCTQSSANTSLKFARFNNIFRRKKNWSRFWFNKNQINRKKMRKQNLFLKLLISSVFTRLSSSFIKKNSGNLFQ